MSLPPVGYGNLTIDISKNQKNKDVIIKCPPNSPVVKRPGTPRPPSIVIQKVTNESIKVFQIKDMTPSPKK